MMTLIIFLFIVSILIVFIVFRTIKIGVEVEIDNCAIKLKYELIGKEYFKTFNVDASMFKKFILKNTNEKEKFQELNKVTLPGFVGKLFRLVRIDNLNVDIVLGTPFVPLTIALNVVASSIMPILLQHGRPNFRILPNYERFMIKGKVNVVFVTSFYKLILMYILLKTKDNKLSEKEEVNL